ncbi:lysozyme [Burkholderia pseudomallei]|uniref:lysozyme n=1 Tax=Burkholderia pseudomallei TaxID=28450 RepID=UPI00398732D7
MRAIRSDINALDDPAEREKRADGAIGRRVENPRANSERPFCPAAVAVFVGCAAVFEVHRVAVNGNVNAGFSDQRKVALDRSDGTERLRVAVRHCTAAGGDGVPGASSAAGVGDGAAAYADVDAAVAERVFGVADDDQREIDKLTALQGYVCAVRPETPGCERR